MHHASASKRKGEITYREDMTRYAFFEPICCSTC
jgi:hypothetical protein